MRSACISFLQIITKKVTILLSGEAKNTIVLLLPAPLFLITMKREWRYLGSQPVGWVSDTSHLVLDTSGDQRM